MDSASNPYSPIIAFIKNFVVDYCIYTVDVLAYEKPKSVFYQQGWVEKKPQSIFVWSARWQSKTSDICLDICFQGPRGIPNFQFINNVTNMWFSLNWERPSILKQDFQTFSEWVKINPMTKFTKPKLISLFNNNYYYNKYKHIKI